MQDFFKLGLTQDLAPFFKENKLTKPTEVQSKVIPLFLEEESLIVISQTGTGKTLSYALPLVQKLKNLEDFGEFSDKGSPQILVVTPTRELAAQVYAAFKGISHHMKCRVRLLTGGDSFAKTKNLSTSIVDILIGTPSRLVSSMKKGELKGELVKFLILDEADQLMDMGFSKDIATIISKIGERDYHTALFSATLAPTVEDLIEKTLVHKKFKKIMLAGAHKVQSTISTFNLAVTPPNKMETCFAFLEKTAKGKGMIFCNQKNIAENVYAFLKAKRPTAKCRLLHGDLSKEERELSIAQFREGKLQFLVCTDLAARGIDIEDMAWVLNYDMPKTATYYIHRAGRTGRMGNKGNVYNFVTVYDHKLIVTINDAIQKHREVNLEMIQMAQPKVLGKRLSGVTPESQEQRKGKGKTTTKGSKYNG
ncbi:MAG: DEAD/DEAH box helicase [Bacteriovoracaceae bacterium]